MAGIWDPRLRTLSQLACAMKARHSSTPGHVTTTQTTTPHKTAIKGSRTSTVNRGPIKDRIQGPYLRGADTVANSCVWSQLAVVRNRQPVPHIRTAMRPWISSPETWSHRLTPTRRGTHHHPVVGRRCAARTASHSSSSPPPPGVSLVPFLHTHQLRATKAPSSRKGAPRPPGRMWRVRDPRVALLLTPPPPPRRAGGRDTPDL